MKLLIILICIGTTSVFANNTLIQKCNNFDSYSCLILYKKALESDSKKKISSYFSKAEKLLLKECSIHDCYNLVCLYAIAGKKEKALKYLKKELDQGCKDWNAYQNDPDLKNIRSTKKFLQLINQYKK